MIDCSVFFIFNFYFIANLVAYCAHLIFFDCGESTAAAHVGTLTLVIRLKPIRRFAMLSRVAEVRIRKIC